MFIFLFLACTQNVQDTGVCNLSVTDKANNLSEQQKEISEIIENQLKQMEISDNIIAAAIVNAVAESNLDPNAIGDNGKSVGAFQLHKNGLGHKLTTEERQNIFTNTNVIGIQILKNSNLTKMDENYCSIPDLAATFASDILRPSNIEQEKYNRRQLASIIFPQRL